MSVITKVIRKYFVFQFKRGSQNEWDAKDPVLLGGEPGVEIDSGRFKLGDGVNHWSDLEYFYPGEHSGGGGGSDMYYLHNQSSPSGTWTVQHDLGKRPNVAVLINDEVIGVPVVHTDLNTVIITFAEPQSGRVICS